MLAHRCSVPLAFLALAATSGISGCFFFNSEWGAEERAQRNRAARITPELERAAPPTSATVRTLRLRVYATPSYRGRTLQWSQRVHQSMEGPNASLAELGIRIVVVDTQDWQPSGSEDELPKLLSELQAHDDADDVDWVLGLVGSVPRLTESFHDLGLAPFLGKHFVIRAANDQERQRIEEAFDELDEAERDRLYEQRAAHKFSALFLHELGHTLGSPHGRKTDRLMYPNYSTDMLGFDPETIAVMRLGLNARLATQAPRDQTFAMNAIVQHLKETRDTWLDPEGAIAAAEHALQQLSSPQHAATTATAVQQEATNAAENSDDNVPADAQDDFTRAKVAVSEGRLDDAWPIITALAANHQDTYAFAELLCDLANRRRLPFREVEKHCASMMNMAAQGRAQ